MDNDNISTGGFMNHRRPCEKLIPTIVLILITSCTVVTPQMPPGEDQPLREIAYSVTGSQASPITHQAFQIAYREQWELSQYVAYLLTSEMIQGPGVREDNFIPDPLVVSGSAVSDDYRYSGYDRGHLAPAADMKLNQQVMDESFYMSNIAPQTPAFNRGIWLELETWVRSQVGEHSEVIVITGPVVASEYAVIGESEVAIPEGFYKVLYVQRGEGFEGIGFYLGHDQTDISLSDAVVPIDAIEAMTGLDFATLLPDPRESEAEGTVDYTFWKLFDEQQPGITPIQIPLFFIDVIASPTDQEQVGIINTSDDPVDLSGFTLGDVNNPTAMVFPDGFYLAGNEKVIIPHEQLLFQINNTGETLYLKNGEDVLAQWSN
jgi:endonuclease G